MGKEKLNSKERKAPQEPRKLESPLSRAYVPIICILGLEGTCSRTDCRMYHSKQPWSWQFRRISNRWSNFPIHQVKEIETAYRDVMLDEVEISPIPKKEEGNVLDGSFRACFSTMTLNRTDGSVTFDIRRLSTKSSAEANTYRATTFLWYLKREESEEWEVIDDFTQLELKYLSSSLSSFITFHHNNSDFKLSLSKMMATKLDTREKVKIRRRPKATMSGKQGTSKSESKSNLSNMKLSSEKPLGQKNENITPQHKEEEIMEENKPQFFQISSLTKVREGEVLQLLDPDSEEALQIKRRLLFTLPNAQDVKVVRVQNQELFRSFNTKITEIKRTDNEPWVHCLFHCPRPDQVMTICRENFSPSLQMENITQICGKGTYFFISAGIAHRFCPEDDEGMRVLMMADVYIGDVMKGKCSLTGPPKKHAKGNVWNVVRNNVLNSAPEEVNEGRIFFQKTKTRVHSGAVFDTVVDDIIRPETFVKYNKRDFYPRYIITFSKKVKKQCKARHSGKVQ